MPPLELHNHQSTDSLGLGTFLCIDHPSRIHPLLRKTLCNSELQTWLANITSRDIQNPGFGSSRLVNPPASYRSLSGPPGPKSQKRSGKSLPGPPATGSPKSLEKVSKKSRTDIFETFSRLFRRGKTWAIALNSAILLNSGCFPWKI